jgi:hypothetical protein
MRVMCGEFSGRWTYANYGGVHEIVRHYSEVAQLDATAERLIGYAMDDKR